MTTETNVVTLEPKLPEPVQRRGINEAAWRTLMNNLYPGADPHSVLMVWDYCVARKLDPLKKPCHIVPMNVKDSRTGEYQWRDVVMPGIYEHRTTATRTGLYMGHSKPEYGDFVECFGVSAPEWCEMTIYRWNPTAGARCEYPVRVYFREAAATRKDKKGNDVANQRWGKAPVQMLTKCTEAAGLREAFPDELGGVHTAEEMEGRDTQEHLVVSPRGDISDKADVDPEEVDALMSRMQDVLDMDIEEEELALKVFDFETQVMAHLGEHRETLVISAMDKLTPKMRKAWKALFSMGKEIAERPIGA